VANEEEKRTCVRCAHVHGKEAQFCIKCGAPLINRCSDEKGLLDKGCRALNPPEAAYCQRCGQPTVFNKAGLVQPFNP